MLLAHEQISYEREKADLLLAHEGQYALIKGDEVAGTFDVREEALRAGFERFGHVPIMVKQIVRAEPVYVFTRPLTAPACQS